MSKKEGCVNLVEMTYEEERPWPANLEAEQAVLGSIILAENLKSIDEMLTPEKFFDKRHQDIFQAALDLSEAGEPTDMVMIVSKLQDKKQIEQIGVTYLSQLGSSVASSESIRYHAQIIHEKFVRRQLIKESLKQLNLAWNAETNDEVIDYMQTAVSSLADQNAKPNEFKVMKDVARSAYEDIEQRFANRHEDHVTGIASGYDDLDKMTCGFQKSDLIYIGARPSVGKTAMALNIASNASVKRKKTVAIFSLEMPASQLVQRMMSAEGNIDATRLRTGYLEGDDWERLTFSVSALSGSPIFIDDSPTITPNEILGKARRLQDKYGLDLIIIDYLQLLHIKKYKENRTQEVSEISRTLKRIARELDIPVIVLSQLSRAVEQRQDKRPMLSDLRESGSIEQDADLVGFLYRDDYYDKESEKKNIMEFILAKQRNGPIGTVELAFLKNFNKFVNLDQGHHLPEQRAAKQTNEIPIPDMYRR
jgi:replicative DNA helicase